MERLIKEQKELCKKLIKPYIKQIKNFHEYKGKNKKKRSHNKLKRYKINYGLYNKINYIIDEISKSEPTFDKLLLEEELEIQNFASVEDIKLGDAYSFEILSKDNSIK